MRDFLFGLMLAATAGVPVIATAQQAPGDGTWQQRREGRWGGDGGGRPEQPRQADGEQRQQWRDRGDHGVQGRDPRQDGRWQRSGGERRDGGWQRPAPDRLERHGDDDRRGFDPRGDRRDGHGYVPDRVRQEQRSYADRRDDYRDRSGFAERARWNRGWRGDQRYDYDGYRSANRGAFHLPRYHAPQGWNHGYRRFAVEVRLSPPLFAQSYWLDDGYDYRLPPAYGSYRWVRYYNDALLVDMRSGYVVDTVYDIFW